MSEDRKDDEKEGRNRRRILQTIADLKQHQDTEKLKDELAKKYEEGK